MAAYLVRGFDRGDEVEHVAAAPDDVHGVVVEILGQVLHLGRLAVVEEQARLVRLVAGTALRQESDLPVVGRPDGVFVVTRHRGHVRDRFAGIDVYGFADVLRHAVFEDVDEDVRIGRNGVLGAGQRLAGVRQHRSGVVPCDFGHVEVGRQRSVPRGVLADDVHAGLQPLGSEVADEDMQVGTLVPVIPVAGHQVVVDAGLRFVHVLVDVRRLAVADLDALYVPRLVAAGTDAEAFDVLVECRELSGVAACGRHFPYLHRAAAVREEVDLLPVGAPLGIGVVRRGVGQARHGLGRKVFDPDGRHAAVFGHVVVGLRIEERTPVGRERRGACTAHFPHHLRGENACGDLIGRQGIVDGKGLRPPAVACAQSRSCNSHKKE